MEIYLRPLEISDALISYHWRNNSKIWEYTGKRPDVEITSEIEKAWLEKVLDESNSKRFAICLAETDIYIGNIQLTSILNDQAEFHIFIGDTRYWGQKIAQKATRLILAYAKNELGLKSVYLTVNKANKSAIRVYENVGFVFSDESGENMNIIL